MTQKQPYYVIDFNMSICNFEILINDMPVFKNMDGGSLSSHYPINHFLLESGIQEITIKILPLLGEVFLRKDSYLKIKIHSFDSETQDYENLNEVFKFKTPSYNHEHSPAIVETTTFRAIIPYSVKGWSNSIKLSDKDNKDAVKYYKKIYELASSNTNKLYDFFHTKLTEVDTALYLNENNKNEWNSLLEKLDKEKFILQPFPTEIISKMYAHKRVVEITALNGASILHYINEKGDEFNFPILIHKKDTKSDFEIIR